MDHKVLVIEDDREINELLGEYLALEKIVYINALDGKTGLEKTTTDNPDAIILDLMLPDIDGYEICRQLATHRATANIPVVILTCLNQECDRHKAISAGAFRFLNKPFFPDDLISRIKDAFEWRRTLLQRPPCGQISISTENPCQALHGINDMFAELFARSSLSEPQIASLRNAFIDLTDWVLRWGGENHRNPHLIIRYRLTGSVPGQPVSVGQSAEFIEWTISEVAPGLLAEVLFAPQTNTSPFSVAVGNAAAEQPVPANPLAPWFQFIKNASIPTVMNDNRLHQIHLRRPLKPEPAAITPPPVITIPNSTALTTALSPPALSTKPK